MTKTESHWHKNQATPDSLKHEYVQYNSQRYGSLIKLPNGNIAYVNSTAGQTELKRRAMERRS